MLNISEEVIGDLSPEGWVGVHWAEKEEYNILDRENYFSRQKDSQRTECLGKYEKLYNKNVRCVRLERKKN